jgi:hypothetical protein
MRKNNRRKAVFLTLFINNKDDTDKAEAALPQGVA